MKKLHLPSRAALSAYLFEQPVTHTYLLLVGVFIFLTLGTMSAEGLPDLLKHFGWLACWLCCSRLAETKGSRRAWAGMGALLLLVAALDLTSAFIS